MLLTVAPLFPGEPEAPIRPLTPFEPESPVGPSVPVSPNRPLRGEGRGRGQIANTVCSKLVIIIIITATATSMRDYCKTWYTI